VVGAPSRFAYPVRTATQDARARFGAVRELDGNGGLGGLAIGADGTVLAAWRAFAGGGPPLGVAVRAARRAPGADWSAPEEVTDRDPAFVAAGVEPRSGTPVVGWYEHPAAGAREARVRLSRRG
jgi:hypothetical protein